MILVLLAFILGAAGALWFHRVAGRAAPPPPLADRINWLRTPFPGVVLQKDGSFLVGWRVRGPDATSASVAEINRVSRRYADAFLGCTDGWCFHADLFRTESAGYAPAGAFPDSVSRLLDEERRAAYEREGVHFESELVLCATWLPPREIRGGLSRRFQVGGTEGVSWTREFERFRTALLEFEDRLHGVLALERLDTGELLSHLYRTLTGRRQRVAVPFHGSYLDTVLCHEPFVADFEPTLGDTHIRVVSIEGYPEEVYPTILDALGRLPFPYRWSSRTIPLSPPAADALIRRNQKGHFEGRKGARTLLGEAARGKDGPANPELERMREDPHARALAAGAQEAIGLNASGQVRYCHFNSCVVIHRASRREAEEDAREVMRVARDAMFTASVERMHAAEAFWGSLPGDGRSNVRRPVLSTRNLAAVVPIRSMWPGPVRNSCQYYPTGSPPLLWTDSDGATPFRLSLHTAGDVGHTVVIGPTGAGKSTILQLIAVQALRYPDAQVFVFDKGRSFELLCRAVGGEHSELLPGAAGGLTLQPLARIDEPRERAWAVGWLGILLREQGLDLTPPRAEVLGRCLARLASDPPRHRNITALMMQVMAEDREMGAALGIYTRGGPYGGLLDADEDPVSAASFQVFEMHHLMDMGEAITVPALVYLLHRLDRRFDAGRPTYLILDEAKSLLGHPYFERKVKEYAVTLRKRNVVLVTAFQSLEQLHELSARTVLLDSSPTRIFLANDRARGTRNAEMYADLDLDEREIELLAEATPKRHYYLKAPPGSRRFELALGPVASAFLFARAELGVEGTLDRAAALEAEHGRRWPVAWLEEAGLREAASRLDTAREEAR